MDGRSRLPGSQNEGQLTRLKPTECSYFAKTSAMIVTVVDHKLQNLDKLAPLYAPTAGFAGEAWPYVGWTADIPIKL